MDRCSKKKSFSEKFRTMILNILEKLTSNVLIFKIVLKDWKIVPVSSIERKYEPCREISKTKRFPKQVRLVKNITFNSNSNESI